MAAPAVSRKGRVPWPAQSRQRFLLCLVCGSDELCARGLCRSCYEAAHHDDSYFSGCKERVLARDGQRCRVDGAATEAP